MTKIISIAIVSFILGVVGSSQFASHDSLPATDTTMSMTEESSSGSEESMTMDGMMEPRYREISNTENIPQIRVSDSFQGKMGEFNVFIELDNFSITPQAIDGDPIENQGHVHVYVNGEKAGRAYSEAIYIPEQYFTPGENKIQVQLSANNHDIYTYNGSVLQDTVYVEYD